MTTIFTFINKTQSKWLSQQSKKLKKDMENLEKDTFYINLLTENICLTRTYTTNYTNNNLKPSEVLDHRWIYHHNLKKSEIDKLRLHGGKFILWYDFNYLDKYWELAKKLFDDGKLSNIDALKCSTQYSRLHILEQPNANYLNENEGVILLYCKNYHDKKILRDILKNIINCFKYLHKSSICYKTNVQTRQECAYKPYVIKNHMYTKKCTICNNELGCEPDADSPIFDIEGPDYDYKEEIITGRCSNCPDNDIIGTCKKCMSTYSKWTENDDSDCDENNDPDYAFVYINNKNNMSICGDCTSHALHPAWYEFIAPRMNNYKGDCPFCGYSGCNCGSEY